MMTDIARIGTKMANTVRAMKMMVMIMMRAKMMMMVMNAIQLNENRKCKECVKNIDISTQGSTQWRRI